MNIQSKKILILGSNGFIGSVISSGLASKCKVFKASRRKAKGQYFLDESNFEKSFIKIIKNSKPNYIINCIGSYTNNIMKDLNNNSLITIKLISTLKNLKEYKIRLILIGSASEYGLKKNGKKIKESSPLLGKTNYAKSKIMQYKIFEHSNNLDIIYIRIFNIFSLKSPKDLFIGNLIYQIKKFKKNKINKIHLKSINSFRDFIKEKEFISKIEKIIFYGKKNQVYNLGSGRKIQISNILYEILNDYSVNKKMITFKNNDVDYLIADSSKTNSISV